MLGAERKRFLLEELVGILCAERGMDKPAEASAEDLWALFRALVNTRPPSQGDEPWIELQDELLGGLIQEAGTHDLSEAERSRLDSRMLLWRGDITTLSVDAIVNAANSQMLGCWTPGHHCIDNAIHTYAGVQLRAECARIMRAQGHEEPTGEAKITSAYNLPAKYVIHTVGPIASGHPTERHRAQLASSYRYCLDLAESEGLSSIAFCCISTGVFGFPQKEASTIAVSTVQKWLSSRDRGMDVIFNVFSAADEAIYRQLLF